MTLLILSGEPDPAWNVPPGTLIYKNIKELLGDATRKGLTFKLSDAHSVLGYKGFLVTTKTSSQVIVGPSTIPLQELLLQTMPAKTLGEKVVGYLKTEIKGQSKTLEGKTGQDKPARMSRKKRLAPAYNADYWSHFSRILQNNCYNYATNIESTTDHVARPGRKSGTNLAANKYTGEQVKNAAVGDKLVAVPVFDLENPGFTIPEAHRADGHLVALYVSKPFVKNGGKCIRVLRCI